MQWCKVIVSRTVGLCLECHLTNLQKSAFGNLSLPPPPVTWVATIVNTLLSIVGAVTINAGAPDGKPRGSQSEYLTTMGVSVLYLVLFLPGSLFCWFLPLYQAYK